MTYRENLPPELAMNLVGEEYSPNHTYTLMFDRDKTVLIISDESGSVIEERELEQNYETLPDDWVDDDDELMYKPISWVDSVKYIPKMYHKELLEKNGEYAKLYGMYTSL